MTISIKKFILTGNLGPIKLGMLKEEVIKCLGPPDNISDFNNGCAELFYNGFRFFYSKDSQKIYAMLCQDFDDSFIIKPQEKTFILRDKILMNTDLFIIGKRTTYKDLKKEIGNQKIKYTEQIEKFWNKIIFKNGVEFLFNNWLEYPEDYTYNKEELELYGFRIFPIANQQKKTIILAINKQHTPPTHSY